MANIIQLAEKFSPEIDKAIIQKSVTGFLADNALRAKFVGAGTVHIPELSMSGAGDYDRESGYPDGSISLSYRPYVLEMDRGRRFTLDAQDADESGVANLAGQAIGEFVRTQAAPEIDAYNLSKLAGIATAKSHLVTGTLATGAYKMFTEACAKVQDYVGYDEELVAFVNTDFYAALQSSTDISRYLITSDFKRGEINTKVKTINDVSLLPAPKSRMKDGFVFYDGTTDASGSGGVNQKPGGFVPAANAKDVGFIVMPKSAASFVNKSNPVRVFDPSKNSDFDGWIMTFRQYYDLIVREKYKDSIFAYTY